MQFSPKGGNEMAQVSSDDAKRTNPPHVLRAKPSEAGLRGKGRRREHNGVFTARWKRNGANFFTLPSSEQSPAKRVCEEKEEGESIMEFSPQGGNGMARTSSDAVRRMCSCQSRVSFNRLYPTGGSRVKQILREISAKNCAGALTAKARR